MFSKEEAKKEISELVERFAKKDPTELKLMVEENVKKNFILPLFHSLGWDVYSDEVVAEDKISKKRVDYAFKPLGITKFFLEAKKPSEDILDPRHIRQAIDYAYWQSVPWIVLTNFKDLVVFNAEWKGKNLSENRFITLNFKEFPDKFDDLWLLSKESFEKNLIDEKAVSFGKKQKREPIGKTILADMIEWRGLLTKNINKYDHKLDEETLDEAVQRILDRLIFIKSCEDRRIEEQVLLPKARQWQENWVHAKTSLWDELKHIFRYFDNKYNSKLFALHVCDSQRIDDDIIYKIITELNNDENGLVKYDFSAIPVDILGNIYEQYLGSILRKSQKTTKIVEKHAHRKEQGIYYTPNYIVDYIVRNTILEYAKSKSLDEILDMKVLDPACGSGSFLIKAYSILLDIVENRLKKGEFSKKWQSFKNYSGRLTLNQRIAVLTSCMHGVDLDTKAVEIAQLNLLLKLLEGETKETLSNVKEVKKLLPMLTANIKCGNSLIDDEKVSDKAFKWEEQFKDIIKSGGFDVVIGNPPYIRIQTLDKKQVDYFNKKYESPEKNYDIYILFIEKGFKLLKEDSILGLILPHKFFQGENGKNIREFIYKNKALHRIVDFGTNQVFENAATYTCLLFLQKKKNKQFYYKGFKLDEDFKNLSLINFEKNDIEILNNNKWNFSGDNIQKVLTKIKSHKKDFRSITKKIFKGSSTGDDKIFLLDIILRGKDNSIVFSSALNREIEIENSLLHPFVYGEDIRRYTSIKSNKALLFPYSSNNNKVELIQIETLMSKYPKAFDYLSKLKNYLLKRKVELDSKNFYKYSAARSLSEYDQPKIMIPDMLISNRISFDEEGAFYHGPAIHSVVFNDEIKKHSQYFYLGILNSKLFWFFITNTSTALRGNAYRLTPEFLIPFCFPEIDSKNSDYDKIVVKVERMIQLNKKLSQIGDKKTDERVKIEDEIKRTDKEIDELVYKIYGITEEEKKIIEESLK